MLMGQKFVLITYILTLKSSADHWSEMFAVCYLCYLLLFVIFRSIKICLTLEIHLTK